jgi:endonuclease YncB( thermonuclease family)
LAIAGLLLCAGAAPALAEEEVDIISGPARAIDADIIIVGDNQRVILWGIDAPERSQTCIANSQHWGCYDAALRTLQNLAGRGIVTCTLTGEPDPFNRRYGVCESGGEDIGEEMVRLGMALAFTEQTDAYADVQTEAITEGVGLWQLGVEFMEPWLWRKSHTPGGYR